ncbi:desiccation/radiation resistance protein [Abditibacteriota bacterium]|nr:desiccation/radiation resistance protein [Abditibacteriota bacterium]
MNQSKFGVAAIALVVLSGATWGAPQRAKAPRRLLRPAEIISVPRTYPAIRWKTTLGLPADTTLAVGDLDLDGQVDLVAPAVDGPAILRLDGRGAVVWRFPLSQEATAGPALGDVDGDGTLDIVVAVENVVLCLNARGALKWRVEIPGKQDDGENVKVEASPTIADLDGDGRAEILVGATDGKLHCLNFQGKESWSVTTKSWIVGGTAVADINGDGQKEVIFGSYDRNLYCVGANGRLKWKYGADVGDWVGSSPVIGDVDGDGVVEILFVSDDGILRCLTRTGTLKWKHRVANPETRMRPYLAVADLDGDGTLETLVPTPDGRLQVFLSNGQLAWSYAGGESVSAPLIADFDGDGYQDILLAAQDGTLRGLSAWGQERFRLDVGEGIESTPVLADTDRDGKWNLYVANLMSEGDTGFLSCFKMTTKGGRAAWTTLKGDPYRTGFVPNAVSYGKTAARGVDFATAWAPYGQSERPVTGTLAPRKLRVSLLPLDDARGNRDGALDPGETAWMRVKVENLGKGPSFDDLLTLDFGLSFLKLDRTSAYIGYLAPGATKTATFRVTAPPLEEIKRQTIFRDINDVQLNNPDEPDSTSGAPAKTRLRVRRLRGGRRQVTRVAIAPRRPTYGPQTLRMSVLESSVPAALSNAVVFNVPPLPPTLKVARVQIIDGQGAKTSGNGNGRLDAGETVVLRVTLRNTDLTTAQNALAILGSGTSDVLVATQQVTFKDVVPYGSRTLDFSLRVAPRPIAKAAKLKLSTYAVTRGGDRLTRAQTLSFPLGVRSLDTTPPQILFDSPRAAIASTRAQTFRISGQLRDSSPIASLMFERKKAPLLPANRFAFVRPLKVGENVFPISASDAYGNTTTRFIRVVRQP